MLGFLCPCSGANMQKVVSVPGMQADQRGEVRRISDCGSLTFAGQTYFSAAVHHTIHIANIVIFNPLLFTDLPFVFWLSLLEFPPFQLFV